MSALSASVDDGNPVSHFGAWLGPVALTDKAVEFSRAGWACPAWGGESPAFRTSTLAGPWNRGHRVPSCVICQEAVWRVFGH